ncbi:MAG TPA: ParB/RepB/Spo0J family partition protein, partial [Dongiaceae bacterium]|nr:ParB/RepB/Spo0J family partition protein [Dongiaceae bacterium]
MTTNAATNLAGQTDKEKVEKRRALGRGLASLLPGPRVLNPFSKPAEATTGAKAPVDSAADAALKGRSSTVGDESLRGRSSTVPSGVVAAEEPRSSTVASGAIVAEEGRSSAVVDAGPSASSGQVLKGGSSTAASQADSAALSPHSANGAKDETPHFSQNRGEVGHPTDSALQSPPFAKGAKDGAPADRSGTAAVENAHPVAQGATRVGQLVAETRASGVSSDAQGGPPQSRDVYYDPYAEAPSDGVIEIQAVAETRVPSNLVINLAIADINKNPFQTRYVEDDDALEELAESIKANGVVQPIVVRPAEEQGRYTLILGERRLHASRKVGKTHIPALVRRVSEQQAAEMTVVENLQREDLSPLEQAEAFRVLSTRFSMTQEEIASRVGLSRASIANYMRLLKLPREVMQMLAEKRLTFGQAKELLKLGDNDRISEAALYAVKKGMNIDQIETLVLRMDGLLDALPDTPGAKKEKRSGGARWVDPNVRAAQMDMER